MMTRASEETGPDLAHTLVSHLDSSAGDFTSLYDALDALSDDETDLDVSSLREAIETADDRLTTAWDELEDGDDPLMSETYIDWDGEGDATFTDTEAAATKLRRIRNAIEDALDAFEDAQDIAEAGESVPVDAVDADFGVYETLVAFMEYIASDIRGMRDIAHRAYDRT